VSIILILYDIALHSAPVILQFIDRSSALIRPAKELHSRSNDPPTKRFAQVAKLRSTYNNPSQQWPTYRRSRSMKSTKCCSMRRMGYLKSRLRSRISFKTNPRKPKYICGDCGKACSSAKILANHYLRKHLEGDSTCEHCTTEQSCARHHVYYNWTRMSNDPKPHQCLSCSEYFATPTRLRAHVCGAQDGSSKPKVSRKRTIVRVETTPVPDSERAHYGVPWPAPSRRAAPAPVPAPQDDRMRIGFVLSGDHRMDVDFVLQD